MNDNPEDSNRSESAAPQVTRRVSRAGRTLRSVGEWWREKPGRNKTLVADTHEDAGWVPAFSKTVEGSGKRLLGIKKKRKLGKMVRRLVPGASFIRCDQSKKEKTVASNEPTTAMTSPSPQSPRLGDFSALACAMRATNVRDFPIDTPTRRVLDVAASSSSGVAFATDRDRADE